MDTITLQQPVQRIFKSSNPVGDTEIILAGKMHDFKQFENNLRVSSALFAVHGITLHAEQSIHGAPAKLLGNAETRNLGGGIKREMQAIQLFQKGGIKRGSWERKMWGPPDQTHRSDNLIVDCIRGE